MRCPTFDDQVVSSEGESPLRVCGRYGRSLPGVPPLCLAPARDRRRPGGASRSRLGVAEGLRARGQVSAEIAARLSRRDNMTAAELPGPVTPARLDAVDADQVSPGPRGIGLVQAAQTPSPPRPGHRAARTHPTRCGAPITRLGNRRYPLTISDYRYLLACDPRSRSWPFRCSNKPLRNTRDQHYGCPQQNARHKRLSRNRTYNQWIKSPLLCLIELTALFVASSAVRWGGRWDSNPRRPEPQSGALPTELRPPWARHYRPETV